MKYSTYSNEELVSIIQSGDEAAYDQLFRNLAPITLHEAEMYRGKMDTYGTEDFLQEGNIVVWEIISRGNFKGGKFSTYFGAAIRNRLIRIWRDYNLKNLVCIGESEDCRGNITRILVESDYAKEYRIKKAEQNKRWYEKKKASQPPKEKKLPMTKEERSRSWLTKRNTTPPTPTSWRKGARRTESQRRPDGNGGRPRGWRRWQHRQTHESDTQTEGCNERPFVVVPPRGYAL